MTKLITSYDDTDQVWYAYEGKMITSRFLGEGRTPENARSDYWSQANGDTPTALLTVDDNGEYCLYDGRKTLVCGSKEDAIAYADAHNWII